MLSKRSCQKAELTTEQTIVVIQEKQSPKVNIPYSQSIFMPHLESSYGFQQTLRILISRKWRSRMSRLQVIEDLVVGVTRQSEKVSSQKNKKVLSIFPRALLLLLSIGTTVYHDTLFMKSNWKRCKNTRGRSFS